MPSDKIPVNISKSELEINFVKTILMSFGRKQEICPCKKKNLKVLSFLDKLMKIGYVTLLKIYCSNI